MASARNDCRALAFLDATYAQGYALASAGRLAAWLLDADDVGVMRIRPDGETVDLVSQHDIDEVGETWQLSDFPATRHLIESRQVGQAVAGDSHGDAAELAELDRSLVHGAHADAAKRALLEALISFAASTGSVVCGEGIEELADLRVLADLDATYAQG